MKDNVPILVFAYNRIDNLKRLLNCLICNDNIIKHDLYIYVDKSNDSASEKAKLGNMEVINFVNEFAYQSRDFREIHIKIADIHKGLAASVISGVTQILNEYDSIIVLEDDLIVSRDFVDYMTETLTLLKDTEYVFSVTGHSMWKENVTSNDAFLFPRGESLGWGTWSDRWKKVDWNLSAYEKYKKNIFEYIKFRKIGKDLPRMLKKQMSDANFDSWAIKWCFHIFIHNGYVLYPRVSYVIHDGNGENSTHGVYISPQQNIHNHNKPLEIACDIKPNKWLIKKLEFKYNIKDTLIYLILRKFGFVKGN